MLDARAETAAKDGAAARIAGENLGHDAFSNARDTHSDDTPRA